MVIIFIFIRQVAAGAKKSAISFSSYGQTCIKLTTSRYNLDF